MIIIDGFFTFTCSFKDNAKNKKIGPIKHKKSFNSKKLVKGEYYGKLTEEDRRNLFDILETTETLSTKQKKRFGIKRR